ncbi:DMT family transporter [Levilactobacillus bambusae]|uniref:QacE family quaternary ammonium compound efflux SMR transporter n=1 Tax=Levilactobacillus bambusae TaxID=2024736 RepID=A0A2V1N0K0_9LACO|nr:multidrug efflux SMR transporter [Levilactobacillus bambusae]PWG00268.1 QacE family quaternary ammonium compound efflux SMR transporter [Levilactobacillus bambusae]
MNWVYLIVAGLLEMVWATTMKLSQGFTNVTMTVITIVVSLTSFVLLAQATKTLPISLAYPIWTGIGAIGSIIVGLVLFGDRLSPLGWGFMILLIVSIIGLKMTTQG